MKIQLNGEEREFAERCTVLDMLQAAGFGERRIAVEVNRQIVPRSAHASRTLSGGDQVEIIQAIGGG